LADYKGRQLAVKLLVDIASLQGGNSSNTQAARNSQARILQSLMQARGGAGFA
jgi:hypothetical protein